MNGVLTVFVILLFLAGFYEVIGGIMAVSTKALLTGVVLGVVGVVAAVISSSLPIA
jgi:hypothetical protein